MDSIAFFFSDSESSEDENINLKRKELRSKADILNINNIEFKKLFRLSKEAFTYILSKIESKFPATTSAGISPTIKLAATLRFLAQGSYQKSVGQDFNIAVCQQTVSKIISETLIILQTVLCPEWISLHMTSEDKAASKRYFYSTSGFPGVIGCVDGSQIRIIKPTVNEHIYYCRKGYHAINAMFICDSKLRIRAVNARYGGSCHDSMIWNVSVEKQYIAENHDNSSWLLGDSGYALEPWLMTPYRSAAENSPEAKYNLTHAKCRNAVERCIGVLKTRFRCLLRELHYSPKKCTQIINVCSMLHNICIHYNINVECEISNPPDGQFTDEEQHSTTTENNIEAQRIRNNIKNSLNF